MENWDVSEWMQVGIKLPAVLVPQFPLWLRLLPLPWRGLQLLGEVWENFQPRSFSACCSHGIPHP